MTAPALSESWSEILRLTPTQRRMLAVLKDGKPHLSNELHACLYDELADKKHGIRTHIYSLRKAVREQSREILCIQVGRATFYQIVHLPYPS